MLNWAGPACGQRVARRSCLIMEISMQESGSDVRLKVKQVAAGDQEALAELFHLYRPRLRRMVLLRMDRRLQGRADASDVIQETFLEVARRAGEYASRDDMPFFLWLRLLASQKLLEFHRRHLGTQQRDAKREISLTERPFPEVSSQLLASQLLGRFSSASQAVIRAEQQAKLEEVLNRLDPGDREILSLRHFEELSNGEAAQVLGLTKSAASNRYIRALRRLKEQLSGVLDFTF